MDKKVFVILLAVLVILGVVLVIGLSVGLTRDKTCQGQQGQSPFVNSSGVLFAGERLAEAMHACTRVSVRACVLEHVSKLMHSYANEVRVYVCA